MEQKKKILFIIIRKGHGTKNKNLILIMSFFNQLSGVQSTI